MIQRTSKRELLGSAAPAYPTRICSTTEGRQDLPNILQDAYGHKCITIFHRYGRTLGAVIPMDAVRLLAGYSEAVDEETRIRIRNAALNFLEAHESLQ